MLCKVHVLIFMGSRALWPSGRGVLEGGRGSPPLSEEVYLSGVQLEEDESNLRLASQWARRESVVFRSTPSRCTSCNTWGCFIIL